MAKRRGIAQASARSCQLMLLVNHPVPPLCSAVGKVLDEARDIVFPHGPTLIPKKIADVIRHCFDLLVTEAQDAVEVHRLQLLLYIWLAPKMPIKFGDLF